MAKGGHARSASTGRYVRMSTAKRNPRGTVVESSGGKGGGKAHRSAITGRYVTEGTAKRHPSTTVTESG